MSASARHPLIQMVLFADNFGDNFYCRKSVVPKTIVAMAERPLSASGNVYEAGWVSAKSKSKSPDAGIPEFTSRTQFLRTVPVLVDVSAKKEPNTTTVSWTIPPPSGNSLSHEDIESKASEHMDSSSSMNLENIPIVADLVDRTDSSSTPHEHIIESIEGDAHSDSLHSSGPSSAFTCSAEMNHVHMVHELGETEHPRCMVL